MATAVFVVIASLTIAGPVVYAAVGGGRARATLDSAKAWLAAAQRCGHGGALRRLRRRA